jgi:hypothetical protein
MSRILAEEELMEEDSPLVMCYEPGLYNDNEPLKGFGQSLLVARVRVPYSLCTHILTPLQALRFNLTGPKSTWVGRAAEDLQPTGHPPRAKVLGNTKITGRLVAMVTVCVRLRPISDIITHRCDQLYHALSGANQWRHSHLGFNKISHFNHKVELFEENEDSPHLLDTLKMLTTYDSVHF